MQVKRQGQYNPDRLPRK